MIGRMRTFWVVSLAAVLLTGARSDGAVKVYTAQLGGPSGSAVVNDIAVDPEGNAFVAGWTQAGDFPTTAGAFQTRFTLCPKTDLLCYHGYVVKLKPSGDVAWATFLEGTGSDSALRISVDANGAVYVAGTTTSPDFPGTRPAPQGAPALFVAKLTADGASLVYSFLFNADSVADLAVDGAGGAYVTGSSGSAAGIVATPGAYRTQSGPGYVAKLNPQGTDWAYLTFFDPADSIAVNSAGEVYIGAPQFSAKLNTTGSSLWWSTNAAITGPARIAGDGAGAAYVARGASDFTPANVEKLGPGGGRLYSRSIGWGISIARIAANSSGELYVSGTTQEIGQTVTIGALDGALYGGETGGYIVQIDSRGSKLLYASYLGRASGAPAYSFTAGVGVDAAGSIYVAGWAGTLPGGYVSKFNLAQTPVVWAGTVVNSASYLPQYVAPGELVTLFGTGMGPAVGMNAQASDGYLPTQLGGTQVMVNAVPAPLLYVSAQQVNAVVPLSAPQTLEFVVKVNGETSNNVIVSRAPTYAAEGEGPACVGVFTRDASGTGQAAALNEDNTPNSTSNPARRGSVVQVWFTGAGPMNPPGADGRITPDKEMAKLVNHVGVDVPAPSLVEVLFAGAAPGLVAGMAQINFRIPDDAQTGPAVPFTVDIGPPQWAGHLHTQQVTLAIR